MIRTLAGILLLVSAVGCADTEAPVSDPPPAPSGQFAATATPDEPEVPDSEIPCGDSATEERLYHDNWITPAMVEIGNFHPGAQAEWPIRLHNGNDETERAQSWAVITDPGETSVSFTLGWPLAGGDISLVAVESDNPSDKPDSIEYDTETKALTVDGLASDASRIITVEYPSWTEFAVYFKEPNRVATGYSPSNEDVQDWVIIADATPVLAPKETREILVTVVMPDDAEPPANAWEFWVAVLEQGQGSVQTEMCSRWLVSMR